MCWSRFATDISMVCREIKVERKRMLENNEQTMGNDNLLTWFVYSTITVIL